MSTEGKAVPTSYVHSGHDFCRDSVKLIQASLTLTAPKIQSSNAAKLLVQGHVHSVHDFLHDSAKLIQASLTLTAPKIQGSNAAELLVQSSNALSRVQGCPQIRTDLLR